LRNKSIIVSTVLLSLIISAFFVSSTAANGVFDKTGCETNGGSWEGPTTTTGVCTYPVDHSNSLFGCKTGYQWASAYLNGKQISYDCIKAPITTPVHIPAEPGRCRIISVDKPIYVGTTFTAEWRGRLNSLRLREPGVAVLFLEPLAGSVHWTGNASRIGTFSTLGVVDVGNYFASCVGELGGVGPEIKTEVIR
jgi:hypothetical protein